MSNPKTQFDIDENCEMVLRGSKEGPVWYLSAWKRVSSAFGAFPSIHLTHSPREGGRLRPQKNPLGCLPAENEREREKE